MLIFIIFSLFYLLNHGIFEVQALIGGEPVDISNHFYQVYIELNDQNKHFCGGVLVDVQFVVTAAHCVVNDNGKVIKSQIVKIGATNIQTPMFSVEVSKVYLHESLDLKNGFKDIAVLMLKKPLPLHLKFLYKRPYLAVESNDGTDIIATVAGYGYESIEIQTEANGKTKLKGDRSGLLHSAKAKILINNECQNFYTKTAFFIFTTKITVINNEHLCAAIIPSKPDQKVGNCLGDSGNGLVHNNVLYGIVSYSTQECDDRKRPTVYTKISVFAKFIKSIIDGVPNSYTNEIIIVDDDNNNNISFIDNNKLNNVIDVE